LFDGKNGDIKKTFVLGDSINFEEYNLCIRLVSDRNPRPHFGVPFLLSIRNPTDVAGSYISRLKVEWAELGAGIINLSLTGTNPEKEIDFLNALIQTYRTEDLAKKNEAARRTIEFIGNQLIGIKDSLKRVEFQLERFGNSSRVKDMSAEAQRLFAKLEAFEIQRAELMIRSNYYKYLEEYMRAAEKQ